MQNAPSLATRTDSPALNELERATALEVEAKDELERLLQWNRQDAQRLDLHEVERGLFKRLIALGLTLLLCHLARRGTGKAGGEVLRDGVPLPYHSNLSRTYLSIFGKLEIARAYYWRTGQAGACPLDAELNLPETRYSYFLQEFGELIGVSQAYDKLTDYLERLLGVSFWKQGAQKVAKQAGKSVQAFLVKGYPIGSGVVEGACRHLVKDRMELGGMHWSKPGAQAILELRAVKTNGDWNEFWRFHVEEEGGRLHSAITRRDSRGFEFFPGRAAA